MKRGSAKIEFYQNFQTIKEAYDNGLVVYKLLYEYLQEKIELKMSYRTFYGYAKKEFEKKEVSKSAKTPSPTSKKIVQLNNIEQSMNEYIDNFRHIIEAKVKR